MDESLKHLVVNAECLFTQAEVEAALDKLIPALVVDYADKTPLVLGVMNGALSTLGYLLPRMPFLLEVDYIHATRYRGAEQGGELVWKAKPETPLKDRNILVIDDILDQGITLDLIRQYCLQEGASEVKSWCWEKSRFPGMPPPLLLTIGRCCCQTSMYSDTAWISRDIGAMRRVFSLIGDFSRQILHFEQTISKKRSPYSTHLLISVNARFLVLSTGVWSKNRPKQVKSLSAVSAPASADESKPSR